MPKVFLKPTHSHYVEYALSTNSSVMHKNQGDE